MTEERDGTAADARPDPSDVAEWMASLAGGYAIWMSEFVPKWKFYLDAMNESYPGADDALLDEAGEVLTARYERGEYPE